MRHGNLSHYQKEWSQSNCLVPCSQGMTGEAQEWRLDFDLVGAIGCSWLLTSHNGVGLIMKKHLLLWRSLHLLELSLLWSLIWILNDIRWGCQNFILKCELEDLYIWYNLQARFWGSWAWRQGLQAKKVFLYMTWNCLPDSGTLSFIKLLAIWDFEWISTIIVLKL